jgi:hypothetical protein
VTLVLHADAGVQKLMRAASGTCRGGSVSV